MGKHAYTRCIIHMIWGTKKRKPILDKKAAKKLSDYFYKYSAEKEIFMHANYVNADHVHVLFDLPTKYSLQDIAKLFKGSSSFWINKHRLTKLKFSWGRGYGAFSVSASAVEKVKSYIRNQKEHHKKRTFEDELSEFLSAYGLSVQNR